MKMMLRSIRVALAVLASLAPWAANASPMSPDPTGVWYDPAQPGWGLSVAQQGDTIFAALFVYDANHNPQWYVASNVVDTGHFVNTLVGEAFSGTLYRTSGPTFSSSTDTTALGVTAAGTIQLAYVQPVNNLAVTYTIDGTTVSKVLAPQTWGSNASQIVGRYSGSMEVSGSASCPTPAPMQHVTGFTVAQGSTPDALTISWGTGVDVACQMNGTYAQRGQFGTLTGDVLCGPVPNPIAKIGTLSISQMTTAASGFSGFLDYSSDSCAVGGTIGGVNTGASTFTPPDPTGVWYDPANPGWGMTLARQGTNIFAVVYVYDGGHQPEWFVASNVVGTGQPSCNGPLVSTDCAASEILQGPLYKTTGPFFGSAMDSTALAATAVGTLQIHYGPTIAPDMLPGTSMALQYTVNGATVTKTVQRQTWGIPQGLAGTYDGGFVPPAVIASCTAQQVATLSPQSTAIVVAQSGATLQLSWGSGASACSATGTLSPMGQLANFTGQLQCAGATSGSFAISNMSIGPFGFSGTAFYPDAAGCGYSANVGGVKRPQ